MPRKPGHIEGVAVRARVQTVRRIAPQEDLQAAFANAFIHAMEGCPGWQALITDTLAPKLGEVAEKVYFELMRKKMVGAVVPVRQLYLYKSEVHGVWTALHKKRGRWYNSEGLRVFTPTKVRKAYGCGACGYWLLERDWSFCCQCGRPLDWQHLDKPHFNIPRKKV